MSIVPKEVVLEWLNEWNQLPITAETPLSWEYIANRAAEWALEMAAKACEDQNAWNMDDPGETAARVIRALIKGGENDGQG